MGAEVDSTTQSAVQARSRDGQTQPARWRPNITAGTSRGRSSIIVDDVEYGVAKGSRDRLPVAGDDAPQPTGCPCSSGY